MAGLIFCAIWILLGDSVVLRGLRFGEVPFIWLFWSTTLTRKENKISFWFALACWVALFLLAVRSFALLSVRALSSAPPFDHRPFLPSSSKDIFVTAVFAVILLAQVAYMSWQYRVSRAPKELDDEDIA